jgi:hypothetical protein
MVRKVLVTAMLLVLLGAGSAAAAHPAAKRPGHCDGVSTSTLAATHYDATRLSVRFAIANSTPGQTWQLFGSDNGKRIFAVNRVVSATGTVAVHRYVTDLAGLDSIKATGLNSDTLEACNASIGI